MNTKEDKILKYSFYLAFVMFVVMSTFIAADSMAFNIPEGFYKIMNCEGMEFSRISINTEDMEELTSLEGVGSVIAARIIDYRAKNGDFRNIEELKQVKGIGEKLFAEIENYICI